MILRAPAFIYPASVWGVRPPGSYLGCDSDNAEFFLPDYVNYQVESSGRRVRWFEVLGNGVITVPKKPPAPFAGVWQWDWEAGVYREYIEPDFAVASYAGLRKPSFISFFLRMNCNGDSTNWFLPPGNADFQTDALVYPFGSQARSFFRKEVMAYTLRYNSELAARVSVFTAGIGTFAQLQVQRQDSVAALNRFKISLVTERQCRVYLESITNLSGGPNFSFSGSGQTFPVAVRGPSDTDLSVSAGGTTFNGGSPEFYLLCGRSSTPGLTTLTVRFDFEVPYDI